MIELNSGTQMPEIGFGTGKATTEAMVSALHAGYRLLDTAQMYGNEAEVGEAVRRSGVDRAAVFLTTKLNNGNHAPTAVRETFTESLVTLGFDYVDLFLMHWPMPMLDIDYVDTWKAMLELAEDGRARAVGVSNFQPAQLERLIEASGVAPAVNQIEMHPYFPNDDARRFCQERGIVVQAWSPLARTDQFGDPVLTQIAQRLGVTAAQVMLRWHLQRGVVAIPKSNSAERIATNMDIHSFELSDQDMTAIATLDKGEDGRRGGHPDTFTG
ncbi:MULTISPECIES: aldo/keto reductase [unclassified Nesterenkonia]|uniref:aldo/keto reductase n=1 Tax=unclassified Nesterenkonia TaxID=2629769 RepID=UPI001F4C588D|nr:MULTISPECIES: aldo/keto reductase [unclassified Nesterenkonia]MCH8561453.1 aldo/keto reductase [Nesterenkonia sp. DZ6]MCH8563898.1 aldo/keto reductase [Nesterenkonia sp. YGD6]MCH8571942.1 aldo/keto reductase [Nesterenkonia sp. AY15]